MPARPATMGSAARRRSRSSPRSNSRRASSPTTKKKNVMRPSFTQWRRSCSMPAEPSRSANVVRHRASYDEASRFTQRSAATVAASRIAALPVSVRRNSRSGVSRFRVQAVPRTNGDSEASATGGSVRHDLGCVVRHAGRAGRLRRAGTGADRLTFSSPLARVHAVVAPRLETGSRAAGWYRRHMETTPPAHEGGPAGPQRPSDLDMRFAAARVPAGRPDHRAGRVRPARVRRELVVFLHRADHTVRHCGC